MDFNNFKLINDKFGHVKGDETLIYFAETLNNTVKDFNGHVYRLGGDEFAVLVKDEVEMSFAEMLVPIDQYLKEIHPSLAIAHGQTLITSKNCNEEYKVELSMKLADLQMYSMKMKSKEVM
jgi:diguanylate cyclase (GGDEF)-like protein